jgi:iron complex transport system substrate-binding protein
MEAVLAARPDVVVLQRTTVHTSAPYHAVGLRTLEVKLDRFSDIHAAIDTIAADAGVPDRGKALNASLKRDLDSVRARVASVPAHSVLFVVGRNPGSLEGIVAAAGNSYLSEAIAIAGGRNIFADARLPYAKVVQEEIVARNPDVIIDMGEHADAAALTKQQIAAEVALWRKFPTIGAVKTGRIHIVSSEVFVVPGPRVAEMVRIVARLLHPQSF